MAFINLRERAIQLKLVYCGPQGAGKTSNLRLISSHLREASRGGLVTIGPDGQGTSFMDFMSFTIAGGNEFDLRVRLYALPGHPRYAEARKLLLKGVDGIIFVADTSASESVNRTAIYELVSQLSSHGKKLARIPLVFQLNKCDLRGDYSNAGHTDIMRALDPDRTHAFFTASSCAGKGVFVTLKEAILLVVSHVEQKYLELTRKPMPTGCSHSFQDQEKCTLPDKITSGQIDVRKLFRKSTM